MVRFIRAHGVLFKKKIREDEHRMNECGVVTKKESKGRFRARKNTVLGILNF